MKKQTFALALVLALLTGCAAPAAETTPTPEPSPAPTEAPAPQTLAELLTTLTAEDIGYVSWGGPNQSPTAEKLAPMIAAAMAHTVDHDELTVNGSDNDVIWSLDFYIAPKDQGGYSGDDAVYAWAGLEENIVEFFGGTNVPEGRVWVEDEPLYQLLRTQNDTPDNIDQAAYAAHKDTVDGFFNGRLAEVWDGGYSAWELTYFALEAENKDLDAQVYGLGAVYSTDPPELACQMLAGGAYVDSALRAHGLEWYPVRLLVVDGQELSLTGDGRAEEVYLNNDEDAQLVVGLPGSVRGIVIYDPNGGDLTTLDVNAALGVPISYRAGDIGNLLGEYSDCIVAVATEGGTGELYRYTVDRTLEYVCPLDDALYKGT